MNDIAQAVENDFADAEFPIPGGEPKVNSIEPCGPDAPGAVQFVSKSANLRLVITPGQEITENGKLVKVVPERAVEFERGIYWTNNPKLIEWMRAHPKKDNEFGGYVEVTPVAPPPAASDFTDLTLAVMHKDTDQLLFMLEEEEKGHNRPELLEPLRKALEGLAAEAKRK